MAVHYVTAALRKLSMYVIKHHNIIPSDMPSHIREMAKEMCLNIFC